MKATILFVIILFSLGCREDVVEFTMEQATANVFVNSSPRSAEIYLDHQFTGKQTPDTLKYLDPGSYSITLKLDGYQDSTVVVFVEAEDKEKVFVSLITK